MSAALTTEWELKLKDYASAAFQKLQQYVSGTEKKLNDVNNAFKKMADSGVRGGREIKRTYGQLEDTLRGLEERQKNAFTTKHLQAYQALINKTKTEMERLRSVMEPPVGKWAAFKNDFSSAASEIPLLNNGLRLLGNPLLLAGAGVFALGVGLKQSVDLAVDYERGMAKINATAQLSSDSLGMLKTRLVEIGSNSGGNFERIPDAYEKILSQTNKVNLSLNILETSLKGAKAGFADIDMVSGAEARILSIVGERNTTAGEVMDTLLKAKQLGAGEFQDFAQYLPQLIASGKNLSISFKDTAGMFSYMTSKGQSATDTAMLMENAFTALQKKQVIEGFDKKGMSLFNDDGSRKNIKDVFVQLSEVMGKMTDFQKTKFLIDIGLHDAQARNAFSVLMSDSEKFKHTMEGVNNALGETDRQLAATGNHFREWGDITDQIKGWGVAIGDFLLPVIDVATNMIEGLGVGMRDIFTLGQYGRGESTDEEMSRIDAIQRKIAAKQALALSENKFGADLKFGAGTPATDYYNKQFSRILGLMDRPENANNIDKKESASELALKNLNAGKPPLGDGSKTGDLGLGVGDNGKIRNLTMNLKIENNFNGDDATDIAKIKRVIADAIVDAARDSMVTIGV